MLLNKLALGTVQFGVDYGISNKNGKTSKDEVVNILEVLREFSYNTLDTAFLYGDSEQVLGNCLNGNTDSYFQIITKTGKYNDEINVFDKLVSDFELSVKRLSLKPHALLLHSEQDLLGSNSDEIYKALSFLKESGQVSKIGVSVYSVTSATTIADKFPFDIIQLPVNVFDQTFLVKNTLQYLKNKNIEIHTRSTFLQGLLLMDNLPENFTSISEHFLEYKKFCKVNKLTQLQAALYFVFSNPLIDKVVLGVNNSQQLKEIITDIDYVSKVPNNLDFEQFFVTDKNIINPGNW